MEQVPWLLVLCATGFFAGVPMGLAYPLGVTYACLAAACVLGFIVGIIKRKGILGKVLIILALIGWTILGLIGLSAGT